MGMMWDGWERNEKKVVSPNMPVLILKKYKHTYKAGLFQPACVGVYQCYTVATEGKVMQINAGNLLVVRGTIDKAFPYVLQEYTAY